MRIIHCIAGTRVDHGGTSRTATSMCDALIDIGMDCHLVRGIPADESIASLSLQDPKRVHSIREGKLIGRFGVGSRFCEVLRDLSSANPRRCIIHDRGIWLPSNHAVARYCRKNSLLRVVSPEGMLGTWARSFHRIRKKVAWTLYQRRDLQSAAAFHATSPQEACEIRSLGFTQPTFIIPNAIDRPSQMPSRSKLDGRRMLFLSRIHPKKGLLTLIAAWKQANLPRDWRLIIAGPDENGHQHEVRSRAKDLGIADQIDFVGPVTGPAKWQLYVDSDVFVLPSFNENFGLVIAEAMAAGLPVITTTATPWEVLREKSLGWWVNPTVPDLKLALLTATSLSERERHDMGVNAAQEAAAFCSWQSVAHQMVEYYHTLLESLLLTRAGSRAH